MLKKINEAAFISYVERKILLNKSNKQREERKKKNSTATHDEQVGL